MRKRYEWVSILLIGSLLAGCQSSGLQKEPASEQDADTQMASDGSASDDTKDASEEETGSGDPAGKDADAESEFSRIDPNKKSSVTNQGTKIKVDYSAYRRAQSKEASYTRLSEEYIPDLKAGNDYGLIYPFTANRHYDYDDLGYGYVAGSTYGVMDCHGRIVADPTYTDIWPLRVYDYQSGQSQHLGLWALGRTEDGKRLGDDYWMVEGDTRYAIASADGSFVTDCIYGCLVATSIGVLAAEKYESKEFTMYDCKGNILFTEKDLDLPGTVIAGSFYGSYAEGLFLIGLEEGGSYFIDARGHKVLGPYQFADRFRNGAAQVTTEEGTGFIDSSGNYLLPPLPEWDETNYYETLGENYVAWHNGDDIRILDPVGKELFRVKGKGEVARHCGGCFFIGKDKEDYRFGTVYDSDGRELYQYDYERDSFCDRSSVVSYYENGQEVIRNLRTQAEVRKERDDYESVYDLFVSGEMMEYAVSGYIQSSYYDEKTEQTETCLYDAASLEPHLEGYDTFSVITDKVTGEEYILARKGREYVMMDKELHPLAEGKGELEVFAGYRSVTDAKGCHVYDPQGEEIFYYPLTLTYDD